MRMRTTSSVFAIGLAAFFAGCNGGSSAIPLSSLEREVANAICQQFAGCPSTAPGGTILAAIAQHPGLYSCADLFVGGAGFPVDQFQASSDAGRIIYDGGAARACLDALATTCGGLDQVLVGNSDCQAAFAGTVPLNGTCYFDQECAGDTHCVFGMSCPGSCQAAPTVGEACDDVTNPCSDNYPGAVLDCTTTMANPAMHCVATTYTKVGAGGSCGAIMATGDQQVHAYCAPGYYCKTSLGSATGTCALPIPLGQTCVPGVDACVDDSLCTSDGMGGYTCEAFTLQSTVGSGCVVANNEFCNPLDRLACVAGTCTLVGTGAVNQPCRSSYPTDCNTGLYCDTTGATDVCLTQLGAGAACTPGNDEACTTGYCDDQTTPASPVCGQPLCGN